MLATYLPEIRFHTLLQPEAMGARLSYALVTIVLMGIGGSALVIRFTSRAGGLSAEKAGFRGFGHVATAVIFGVVLGPAFYAVQGAPSWNRGLVTVRRSGTSRRWRWRARGPARRRSGAARRRRPTDGLPPLARTDPTATGSQAHATVDATGRLRPGYAH